MVRNVVLSHQAIYVKTISHHFFIKFLTQFFKKTKKLKQKKTMSFNLGRKTPISFDLRKYVEKHCNGSQ